VNEAGGYTVLQVAPRFFIKEKIMGWVKGRSFQILPSLLRTSSVNIDLEGKAAEYDELMVIVDVTASVAPTSLDVLYQVKANSGAWVTRATLATISGNGVFLLEIPDNIGLDSRLMITSVGTSFTYSVTGVGKNAGGRG